MISMKSVILSSSDFHRIYVDEQVVASIPQGDTLKSLEFKKNLTTQLQKRSELIRKFPFDFEKFLVPSSELRSYYNESCYQTKNIVT